MAKFISNKRICSLLWTHQFIDPTGRIKPCCRHVDSIDQSGHNLKSSLLSQQMNSFRQSCLSGSLPSGCIRCIEEELSGKKSLRQRYNENSDVGLSKVNLDLPQIIWLEFSFGNKCNLACRMCDSRYSSRWFDEEKRLFQRTLSSKKNTDINFKEFDIDTSKIKHLKITGGEPLLSKKHLLFLKTLVKSKSAKNIYLNYSTNCTIFPSDEILNLWGKFKYVEIALSLDSIVSEENEYIRYPTRQDIIFENIEKFLALNSFIRVIFRPTVSLFNVWHLPDTLDWCYTKAQKSNEVYVTPTHLTFPKYFSLTALPSLFKKRVEDRLSTFDFKHNESQVYCQYIIRYMNMIDDSTLINKFQKITNLVDRSRNQNFIQVYPYFKELLSNDNMGVKP